MCGKLSQNSTSLERRAAWAQPVYHAGRGYRIRKCYDGWTDNGRFYYKELVKTFRDLKNNEIWDTFQKPWQNYQVKYYSINESPLGNNVVDNKIEGSDSNEENWAIDVGECSNDDDKESIDEDNDDEDEQERNMRRRMS